MEIVVKLILNVAHHGWPVKKVFHSRSPKTALSSIPFTLLSYWEKSGLHLTLESFYKTEL